MGAHPRGELVDGDVDAEVHNVPDEVGRVDLGRFDLDNGPILGEPVILDVETDGGRQNDVADDSVLAVLPVVGGVWEELLEDFNRLSRLLQLGLDLIPLRLSVLWFHLLSSLQPLLELLDDNLPVADLGLDGREVLLRSGVAEEQDLLAGLAGVGVLDQLVVVAVSADDDVTGCHEEELAGVARVEDEETPGPVDGWPGLGRDGETDGSGEGLDDADGREGGGDRLV